MTTEEARKALNKLKDVVDQYVFDPTYRTYYGIAIDTAINGMDNYERLLHQILNEERQKLLIAQHECDMNILRYKIFREGVIPDAQNHSTARTWEDHGTIKDSP